MRGPGRSPYRGGLRRGSQFAGLWSPAAFHEIVIAGTYTRNNQIYRVFMPRHPSRVIRRGNQSTEGGSEIIRTALAVALLGFGATALLAQGDPIAARKALMKANGDQNRVATEMLEGKRPFNLDEAKKVLATFAEAGEKAPALFPDDSKTGGDTAALPPIWENKADFNAKLAKFASDSKAAMDASKDLDSFKIQITEVRKNCGGCHQTYRKRTS
jgi:cytochrome c556